MNGIVLPEENYTLDLDYYLVALMFLSVIALIELTDRKYVSSQVRWLQKNGFRFVISDAGKPKVLKAEVDRVLLGGNKSQSEPDFSKING